MSRSLNLALGVTITLISLLSAAGFYFITSSDLEEAFDLNVDQTFSFLDGALAPMLWTYDYATIEQVAQSVLRDNLIAGITIQDQSGTNIFSSVDQVSDETQLQSQPILYQGVVVGNVELLFSQSELSDSLAEIVRIVLVVWFLTVLSITLLTTIFIRKYFRGPLENFIRLTKTYEEDPDEAHHDLTPFVEFQPIEEVVKKQANELMKQLSKLRESEVYLENVVEERTSELVHANEKLKELDQLKSMFIATMSHELRTPLNSIISFSGILLQDIVGGINERQRDCLERVQRSANHLLSLISDVVDISKIEAAKIDIYPEAISLREIVEEALGNVRHLAEEKQLSLLVNVNTWPTVRTDRRRLLQCLVNLLSNAIKYTEKGHVTLSLNSDEDNVSFQIEDTGVGIAKHDLPKLFRAFERLEPAVNMNIDGVGLGGYLSKKIANEILGGDITAQSVKGEGSTFILTIPTDIDEPPITKTALSSVATAH